MSWYQEMEDKTCPLLVNSVTVDSIVSYSLMLVAFREKCVTVISRLWLKARYIRGYKHFTVLVQVFMGLTDEIRKYVFQKYIKPSVESGQRSITLRAGDIHSEMGLKSKMPAVCTALRSRKSLKVFNEWLRELGCDRKLRLTSTVTPPCGYGSNSYYTYSFVELKESPTPASIRKGFTSFSGDVSEKEAVKIMSEYLCVLLRKERVDIMGKKKEFDMVSLEHRVVGDFKFFKYKGEASAEMCNMFEYACLMEKLEKHTGVKWRKMIVGAGNRGTFEKFSRRYGQWLGDVEVYYITTDRRVERIR